MFIVLFVGMGNTSLQSEHTLSCLHLFNVTSNWIIYFISPYHILHYITLLELLNKHLKEPN